MILRGRCHTWIGNFWPQKMWQRCGQIVTNGERARVSVTIGLTNRCGPCERVPGVHTKELGSELVNCNLGGVLVGEAARQPRTAGCPGGAGGGDGKPRLRGCQPHQHRHSVGQLRRFQGATISGHARLISSTISQHFLFASQFSRFQCCFYAFSIKIFLVNLCHFR